MESINDSKAVQQFKHLTVQRSDPEEIAVGHPELFSVFTTT